MVPNHRLFLIRLCAIRNTEYQNILKFYFKALATRKHKEKK